MGLNVKAIESRISDAVHSVLGELEGAEPTIETGVAAVLVAAGAPATLATAADSLLTELLNHFRGQAAAPAPAAQPTAPVDQPVVTPVAANQLSN